MFYDHSFVNQYKLIFKFILLHECGIFLPTIFKNGSWHKNAHLRGLRLNICGI